MSNYSILAGLILEMLFVLVSTYDAMHWGETYWLMNFPLINSWVYAKRENQLILWSNFLLKQYVLENLIKG